MTSDFMINNEEINKILYLIQRLKDDQVLAEKLKDGGAYNKIVAIKLNLREYLNYFLKRYEKQVKSVPK